MGPTGQFYIIWISDRENEIRECANLYEKHCIDQFSLPGYKYHLVDFADGKEVGRAFFLFCFIFFTYSNQAQNSLVILTNF